MKTVFVNKVEAMMLIAEDTHKKFSYDKSMGTWSWYDSDEQEDLDAWHMGFKTFLDALESAVEPYMDEDK